MIDWERVSQLREEVGHEDFGEVVELFLEEVEEVVSRLRRALDQATLGEDLHFLKGSALNLGFERFGMLCQEGERAVARGRVDEVLIDPILGCYEASRRVFLETVAHRKVA